MKSVVLLSGGLDSTTVLAHAVHNGDHVEAINIDYGQRHRIEIKSARRVAEQYRVKLHEIVLSHVAGTIRLLDDFYPATHEDRIRKGVSWGGSSLLSDGEVPTLRSTKEMSKNIPNTYVPARNLFMIGLATSLAEAIQAEAVYIGVNELDSSGYVDCRPLFIGLMQDAMTAGTKCGVEGKRIELMAPLIHMSKADIIRHAVELKAPLHLTWSCYKGGEKPCGECDSCLLRAKGFKEAGIEDPALS